MIIASDTSVTRLRATESDSSAFSFSTTTDSFALPVGGALIAMDVDLETNTMYWITNDSAGIHKVRGVAIRRVWLLEGEGVALGGQGGVAIGRT